MSHKVFGATLGLDITIVHLLVKDLYLEEGETAAFRRLWAEMTALRAGESGCVIGVAACDMLDGGDVVSERKKEAPIETQ